MAFMKAMVLNKIASLEENPNPLTLVQLPIPGVRAGHLLVHVSVCGVCHTELDEIEGRTPPSRLPVILGHEIVGIVVQLGAGVAQFSLGDRVGIGWIYSSSGDAQENLHPAFRATGRDVDGGYAEYVAVPAGYAYPIPPCFSDQEAAPLLCAGAIGYRALKLTNLRNGDSLGLMGFGGSAHLALQIVKIRFPNTKIHVFSRNPSERNFAERLGADWVGPITQRPPHLLQAIIDTTPAWLPVVEALADLQPGGRLVINAIRKEESDKNSLLQLNYSQHLWMEKEIKSVANITARDIRDFLTMVADNPIHPTVSVYPLEDANRALNELKQGSVIGAKVLVLNKSRAL